MLWKVTFLAIVLEIVWCLITSCYLLLTTVGAVFIVLIHVYVTCRFGQRCPCLSLTFVSLEDYSVPILSVEMR